MASSANPRAEHPPEGPKITPEGPRLRPRLCESARPSIHPLPPKKPLSLALPALGIRLPFALPFALSVCPFAEILIYSISAAQTHPPAHRKIRCHCQIFRPVLCAAAASPTRPSPQRANCGAQMVAEIPARSTPATASASDGPQTDKGTPESAQRLEEASTSTAAKIKTPPSTSGGEEAQQRQKDIADSVDTADSQAPAASSDLCSVCFGCALTIHDRYLYKVLDQCYHEKCLCCSVCREQFSASTCFTRNGLLFCREHFLSAFGPKCSRCAAPIGERSIVRRANQHIYHLECFQCVVCKRELNTGDQFYLIPMDGRLVCRQDFENATKEGSEMDCGNKRPRTTISAKSLETLKQAYQTSSKPARHVREQLAAQTGLDMRVVQVWFQNRRAKEKRLKKDAGRRWAAQQAANGHSADGGAATGGNSSNGSGGSGPASVSTAAGVGVHFGRGATLDSDSGASNGGESAESPFYAYTNPETSSDVDVHSMSDFYDPNGFLQGPPPDGANPMGSGIPAAPSGTPGSLQQLSAMMPPLMEMEQQQNMSPQQQRTPPSGRHQQQQLVMLEQLNAGNGPAMERQRATPMGSGGMGMGSAPGTPQQQQQMGPNTLFALQGSGVPPMLNGHCQANGLLSDQQQQYLLAAAAAGFAPPPPQMAPPPMGQFMPPAGLLASMPPGCPDVMSQMGPAPFYQPHPQHHMSQFQMMGHYAPNSQQQPIQQ